jgi:AP-3 complex subunit delta-1
LTPLEPRLGKKLIEPLTNLIHSTSAMSLLYECINTVIAGKDEKKKLSFDCLFFYFSFGFDFNGFTKS